MKNEIFTDERTLIHTFKTGNEAYKLLSGLLLISIFVQMFLLHRPHYELIPELACLIIATLYVVVRTSLNGILVYPKNYYKTCLFGCAGLTISFMIFAGYSSLKAFITAVPIAIFLFSVASILRYITKRKLKEAELQFNNDSDDSGIDD